MKKINKNLKKRVEKVKEELKSLGFTNSKNDFSRKYSEYLTDTIRLDNLWYCKVADEEFTSKLESFLTFKKTQYK